MGELRYTPLPARLNGNGNGHRPAPAILPVLQQALPLLGSRRAAPNRDGDVEVLGTTRAVHRFVEAPGDSGSVRWHFVEAGEGEPVVLLHGMPDSWYMWHRQIDVLSKSHRVLAIDLKGFGQSEKAPGDYRPEGVAEQLVALFDVLGLDRVNLATHDRGSVVADYLGAEHPYRVRRYARGQQHLYHFNEGADARERLLHAPLSGPLLRVPSLVVATAYGEACHHPVPFEDLRRMAVEWGHPGVATAAVRYFQSSSLHKEWVDRRSRLMASWRFPVLVLQGEHDGQQPSEFYDGIEGTMPDASVALLDAGHFFVLENPQQTTRLLQEFLRK